MILSPVHALFSSIYMAAIFLIFSIMAGLLGRDTRIGFWGFFFVSLMFTPVVSLIFMFFSTPVKKRT